MTPTRGSVVSDLGGSAGVGARFRGLMRRSGVLFGSRTRHPSDCAVMHQATTMTGAAIAPHARSHQLQDRSIS